jgi:two-component system LytT family response regulator
VTPGARTVRVLIVDDEPDARERIREILAAVAEAEIVAEAGDGLTAARLIRELEPDLVFLDIQMPEVDGFGVLTALGDEPHPRVVFVTAFDHYAVRAFEVQAVDYILKPFDRERIHEAFSRAQERLGQGATGPSADQIRELVAALPSRQPAERFLARTMEGFELVRAADIDWIEATGSYVTLHVGKRTTMLRQTVARIEQELDPRRLRRIHRSTIVNLDRIKAIHPTGTGEYYALLADGTRLRVGRTYHDDLLAGAS